MNIETVLEQQDECYIEDIDNLSAELTIEGVTNKTECKFKKPITGYGLLGPESIITIEFDPNTLQQLFEYTTAIFTRFQGIWWFWIINKIFGKVTNKIFDKLLEKIFGKFYKGVKVKNILYRFWAKICHRIRSRVAHNEKPPEIGLCFEYKINGVPVHVYMGIFPSRIKNVSRRDENKAFKLLIHDVMPLMPNAINQARENGELVNNIYVTLALPENILESRAAPEVDWRRGVWHWHISINKQREFIIDRRGRRKDKNIAVTA